MAKTFASEHPDLEGLTQAEFCYCIWELCRAANELERLFWRVGDDEPPTGPWAEAIQDGMESGTLTEAPEITPTLHYDPRLSKWYCQDGTEKSEPSFEEFIADYEGGDRALSYPWPENISQISVSFGENVRRVFAACRKLVYLHPYHYELGEDTRLEFQFEARLFDPITGGAIKYLTQLHLQPPDSLPELIDDGEPDFPWYDEELIELFSVPGTLLFDNKDYGDLPESFQHEEYPWWWGGEDLPDWLELTGDTDPEYVPTNIYPGYRGGLPEWVRYLREVLLAMTNVVWVIGDHRPHCTGTQSTSGNVATRSSPEWDGRDPLTIVGGDEPAQAIMEEHSGLREGYDFGDEVRVVSGVEDLWEDVGNEPLEITGEAGPEIEAVPVRIFETSGLWHRDVVYGRPLFWERFQVCGGSRRWHGHNYSNAFGVWTAWWNLRDTWPPYNWLAQEMPFFFAAQWQDRTSHRVHLCTKYTCGSVLGAKRAYHVISRASAAPEIHTDLGGTLLGVHADPTWYPFPTDDPRASGTYFRAVLRDEEWPNPNIGSQSPVGEFGRSDSYKWLPEAAPDSPPLRLNRNVRLWWPYHGGITSAPQWLHENSVGYSTVWRGRAGVHLNLPKRPGLSYGDTSGSNYKKYSHIITDISSELSYVSVEPEESPE